MNKTLLLVFIHGFKGGDDTFGNFPEHLRAVVSRCLPSVRVVNAVYPKYETRGELNECVGNFREWLQNQVIDLEVENRTASPTVDPSVHVFLVGHSMGGIVAAETLLLLSSEQPIPHRPEGEPEADKAPHVEPGTFMFPHVQGVLALDTPFLGISPGVISYGAESHYRNASSAYNTVSEVAGLFGLGGSGGASSKGSNTNANNQRAKSSQNGPSAGSGADAAATPSWQRWGRYAMFAGAAGAVAAGGAAAMYTQRHRITGGWDWVSSHLAFVGCLARSSDLRQRLTALSQVEKDRGIRCTNFYTCLGKNAAALTQSSNNGQTSFSQKIIRSKYRTFCALPKDVEGSPDAMGPLDPGVGWIRTVNDNAGDEITAHVSMFLLKQNPAFYELVRDASNVVVKSIDQGWYSTAESDTENNNHGDNTMPRTDGGRGDPSQSDSGFMDGDDVVVVD